MRIVGRLDVFTRRRIALTGGETRGNLAPFNGPGDGEIGAFEAQFL
jgi:hypothetical protein